MKRARTRAMVGLLTIGVGLSMPRLLLAQGGISNCEDLPNTVFMGGTTAVIPVIRLMGARLKKAGVTLLWNENSDGCSAVSQLVEPDPKGLRAVFSHYDEVEGQPGKVFATTCNTKPDKMTDLVINDVSWSSCLISYSTSGGTVKPLPASVKEFKGPVQGLVPIVASSYTRYNDVTSEELQDIYICGGKARIMSFSENPFIFDYNAISSGMRELWARGIGVANGSVLTTQIGYGGGAGNNISAESMVIDRVGPTLNPDQTIGYTSTEFYDQYRDRVRGLKVRGQNQLKAYWPDFDMTTTDKINIREGRYVMQGPLRLITNVDAAGVPSNPRVKQIIDWFQQNPEATPLHFDVIEVYAQRGVVPQCAMKVTSDGDVPLFKRYKHPQPCHCSFQVLATGKTNIPGCTPCAGVDAGTCQPGQMCSHGYCEPVN